MARIGHIETLESEVPSFDAWVDLHSGSSNHYGEHGDTGGEHTATGVWAYLRTTDGSVNTKCVLRNAATGAHLTSSVNVVVNSATGAWYYFPLSGTFTQTNVAWFVYADSDAQLGIARRTTATVGDIKKHPYNSNAIYDNPIIAISGWDDNIHNLFSYYEYDLVDTNTPATGVPVITGTKIVGETLSADVSGIADAEGITSYEYQWNRNGSPITDQANQTYLLVTSDIGMQITVSVIVIDNNGNTEAPLVSAPTSTILAAGITTSETVEPKSGYDYVELSSVSVNAAQTVPALQVGYQLYADTRGGTIALNADGTISDSAFVEVHDSTVWVFPQLAQLVSEAAYEISDVSPTRAGEPFTVTASGAVDLSSPAVISLDFGGVSLAAQSQTGNTAIFIAPDSGLEHGVSLDLVLNTDGESSAVYQSPLLPPTGKNVTKFITISPESWLSEPPYTGNAGGNGFNLGTDDQFIYDALTTPGGYPANIDESGIASMDDGGAATESQTIEWYYLDAQAAYTKSGSQVFTLEVSTAVIAQLGHISKTQTLYPITAFVELGSVIAQLGHISKTQTIYPISFDTDIGDPSDLPVITEPAPLIVMYPADLSKISIGHIDIQNWLKSWSARDVNQNILDLSFNLPSFIAVANSPITVFVTAIDSSYRVKKATSTITIQQLSSLNSLPLMVDGTPNYYEQKGSRYYELDV